MKNTGIFRSGFRIRGDPSILVYLFQEILRNIQGQHFKYFSPSPQQVSLTMEREFLAGVSLTQFRKGCFQPAQARCRNWHRSKSGRLFMFPSFVIARSFFMPNFSIQITPLQVGCLGELCSRGSRIGPLVQFFGGVSLLDR